MAKFFPNLRVLKIAALLSFPCPTPAAEPVPGGLLLLTEVATHTLSALNQAQETIANCDLSSSQAEKTCSTQRELKQLHTSVIDLFHSTPESERENRNTLIHLSFALDERLSRVGARCDAEKFRACYPKLRPSVSLSELKELYEIFRGDPHIRHAAGGGACHLRAEALAYRLAERGFAARTLRIQQSPTLIALDRDRDGKLSGGYYDYQGYHTVVEITVRENGTERPYVLDPQFFNQPLPRREYFLRTTGQSCLQSTDSPLGCRFELYAQNHPSETRFWNLTETAGSACGWAENPLHPEIASMKATEPGPKKELRIQNAEHTPEAFQGKTADENSYKQLILHAYGALGKKLAEQAAKGDPKAVTALKALPGKLEEVKANLSSLP